MFNETLKKIYIFLLSNTLIERSVKQSDIITYQSKTFEMADIKSDITEHPKTSQKLPKTIRNSEKVDFIALYIVTQK